MTYNFTIADNDNTSSQNSDNHPGTFGEYYGAYGCTLAGGDCWLGNSANLAENPGSPVPTGLGSGVYGQVTLSTVATCGTTHNNCVNLRSTWRLALDSAAPIRTITSRARRFRGPPAAAFAFNSTVSGLTPVGLPSGWSLVQGPPALDDPFGMFTYYLSGTSINNGSLVGALLGLTFDVASAGGFSSVSPLVQSNGQWCPSGPSSCDGFYYAVHAYGQDSNGTFDSQVGAISPAVTVTPLPRCA